jgi:acyl carrier protein
MGRLEQVIAEVFGGDADGTGEDTAFSEYLGWDSLRHVQLVVALQARYGIDLTADEIRGVTSVRAARAMLARRGLDD